LPGQGEEIGPFDIPVLARGTIKIGKTLYQGLAIDDFHATYQLRDNVLTISRMDGRIAGGSFANKARVDLGTKGLSYSANLGIKGVQADPLLTAFVPKAAGSLLGAMTLDLDVKGRGTRWQTLNRQLNGQGDILVADGRVVSPALVKGFVSFLQMSDTDGIRFKNFRGDVRIVDGKLNIDSSIFSDELKIFPKGSIGLDGTMNLSLDTRLSPALAARLDSRGKVTRYLTDSDGWSRVPLLVSGSYEAPVFGLDPKGLQQQATDALGKELGRQLDKLFGAQAPDEREQEQAPAEQESEPAEDPTNKLLQDSLKRLFGN
jgi:AsmA protein